MAALNYPVRFRADDNDTIHVSFPDFPEAHTFGDDPEEALLRAADALATIIDAYIRDRRPIPVPSKSPGARTVAVPALTAVKVELYELMRRAGVGKAQLATRLNWHLPQVDRLLDVYHGSRLDQLETAFSAFGKRMVVSVEDIEGLRRGQLRRARPAKPVGRPRKSPGGARRVASVRGRR